MNLSLWQKLTRLNWFLFALMMALALAGIFFITCATHDVSMVELQNAARQQRMWLMVGVVLFFVISLTDYEIIIRFGPLAYLGAVLILAAVLVFGHSAMGATRWIRIGGFGIQPVELCKVAYIVGISWFFNRMAAHIKKFWFLMLAAAVAAVPFLLIVVEPDLGSACVLGPITFGALWVAGARKRYLAIPALGIGLLVFFSFWVVYKAQWDGTVGDLSRSIKYGAVHALNLDRWIPVQGRTEGPDEIELHHPAAKIGMAKKGDKAGDSEPRKLNGSPVLLKTYQLNRIETFYNPDLDPLGAAWTIRQSMIAIGSGGWKGKGYSLEEQSIYSLVPKNIAYNDFIFSVVGEEVGFTGGTLFIVGQSLLILTVILMSARAKDLSGSLLTAGFAAMLFSHFFVNVGMTIKVVPITGIPLPFTSYGGSFLLACMMGMGLAQSVWIHRRTY